MPDIPLLIALAAGLGALASARGVWRRRDVSRWPVAEATITRSEVAEYHVERTKRESPPRYRAEVSFTFRAGGQAHHSDLSRFDGSPTFATRREAEAFLADYPEGRTLPVRYRPDDPTCAQLGARRLPARRLGLTLFLVVMAVGALVLHLR